MHDRILFFCFRVTAQAGRFASAQGAPPIFFLSIKRFDVIVPTAE
jgi:hypothetical protein